MSSGRQTSRSAIALLAVQTGNGEIKTGEMDARVLLKVFDPGTAVKIKRALLCVGMLPVSPIRIDGVKKVAMICMWCKMPM